MKQLTNEYKFCFIAPTEYIDVVANFSNVHLTLAHIAKENEEYCEKYRALHQRGDFVYMDNGAFELGKSYDPDKLVEIGEKLNADVIVLPDYPFEHVDKTIGAAERYIDTIKSAGFKTMFVPQSEEGRIDQWIAGYTWAAENPAVDVIGMSILGIPHAWKKVTNAEVARVAAVSVLHEKGIIADKHHHFLGLTGGPGIEIPTFMRVFNQFTVDSSGPVWAAIHGIKYRKEYLGLMAERKHVLPPVNFNFPYEETHVETIKHNCLTVNELLQGGFENVR